MSTQISAVIVTTDLPVDTAAGLIKVDCTGPVSFPEQQVAPGSTVAFTNGSPLPPGNYIITATSLDAASTPLALNGVPYPAVQATVTVPSALTGPVAVSLSLTLS